MFSFLTPYLGTLRLIMYLVMLVVGIGIGLRIDQSKIISLSTQLGASQHLVISLNAAVEAQNSAIATMNKMAAARALSAQQAVDAAKLDAKQARQTAQQILLKRAPKGQDACAAASQDFSDELRAERGNPK